MNDTLPVLYILMRNDLESMNAGKAMAQASHASNAFIHNHADAKKGIGRDVHDWQNATAQGFGTVLVLAVNEAEMRGAVDVANKLGYAAEVIHDPTYPLVDGDVVHYLPLDTCAYVFCPDKNSDDTLPLVLGRFPLYP